MQRFFIFGCEIDQKEIVVVGDNAHHISKSLRMRVGEQIVICDGHGMDFECEIGAIAPGAVTALVRAVRRNEAEPEYSAVLYQGLPKGDKMDFIVQKAVELGVRRIVPFESGYCVARIGANHANKLARWRRIACEAAMQCGRGIIPEVAPAVPFGQALEDAAGQECSFLCYEGAGTRPLGQLARKGAGEYAFFVGPEGGFSQEEVGLAARSGIPSAGLGQRILRCETAPGFVLSCLCMENELR